METARIFHHQIFSCISLLIMKEEVMEKEEIVFKLNKKEFSIISLSDPSGDKYYWFGK